MRSSERPPRPGSDTIKPITHFNEETKIVRQGEKTTITDAKELFRRELERAAAAGEASAAPPPWGKIAQRLRALDDYRKARCVYASLHPALEQARVNAVNDRKALILPTPGLSAGFRRLHPERLRPGARLDAVSPRPQKGFGERLEYYNPPRPLIDLVLAESFAVSPDGIRIGDGSGFLDLQIAILANLGWLDPAYRVVTLVMEEQIRPGVPRSPWDVPVDRIITEQAIHSPRSSHHPLYPVLWGRLSARQVKRNHPLFHLHQINKEFTTRPGSR